MTMPEPPPPEGAPPTGPTPAIDQGVLNGALKAFKKRLKAVKLDDESRLGGHGLSGGRSSGIVGIVPPNSHPREVWDELVRQGRLRRSHEGLYEIVEPPTQR
jgi:hypothetical protein